MRQGWGKNAWGKVGAWWGHGLGKVGARLGHGWGKKSFGQGRGMVGARLPLAFLPQPCPNLASTLAQPCPVPKASQGPYLDHAPTLPQPCPKSSCPNHTPTMPQPCPDFAPNYLGFAPTMPQPCPKRFGRLPSCRSFNGPTALWPLWWCYISLSNRFQDSVSLDASVMFMCCTC